MSLEVDPVWLQSSSGPFWFGKATDSLSQLTQCPLRSRNINIQGSVFYLFIPAIHIQSQLGCHQLVLLNCLCVSQVSHHPAIVKPGIGKARTATIWRRIMLWG